MLNPANFPSEPDYHMSGFFEETELDKAGFETHLGGAVLDRNPEVLFPALATYRQSEVRGPSGTVLEEMDIEVSIGKAYNDWSAFGVSVSYLDQDLRGGADDYYINSSVGFVFLANKELSFGLVFENILDNYTVGLQPATALAVGYSLSEVFRVGADFVIPGKDNPEKHFTASLGAETFMMYGMVLRAGYRVDQVDVERYAAFGLGWRGPRIYTNYAFEKALNYDNVFTHSLDLGVYF